MRSVFWVECDRFFGWSAIVFMGWSAIGVSSLDLGEGDRFIHTKNLPLKNATPDSEINKLSILEQRIVITKDKDFLDSFLIKQEPYKLLLITTGNISNKQIEQLFLQLEFGLTGI